MLHLDGNDAGLSQPLRSTSSPGLHRDVAVGVARDRFLEGGFSYLPSFSSGRGAFAFVRQNDQEGKKWEEDEKSNGQKLLK